MDARGSTGGRHSDFEAAIDADFLTSNPFTVLGSQQKSHRSQFLRFENALRYAHAFYSRAGSRLIDAPIGREPSEIDDARIGRAGLSVFTVIVVGIW